MSECSAPPPRGIFGSVDATFSSVASAQSQ
jgi:hypothetical protein